MWCVSVQMQSDRRQMIVRNKSLRDHYAWEVQRNNLLTERLGQCSQELQRLRDQIDVIAQFARELPDHFVKHLKDEMVRLHDVNARVVSNELEKNKRETTGVYFVDTYTRLYVHTYIFDCTHVANLISMYCVSVNACSIVEAVLLEHSSVHSGSGSGL